MDPLIIPFSYQVRHLKLIYTILLVSGCSIIFILIYDSAQQGIPEGWLWYSILGLGFLFGGLWGFRNYMTHRPYALIIDDTGIRSNHTLKTLVKSVQWNELSSMTLHKRYVKVQYKFSGDYDKIHFPVQHQHNEIKTKLAEAANKYKLAFSVS